MKSIYFLSSNESEIDKIENLCSVNQISLQVFDNIQLFLQALNNEKPALLIIDNEFSLINIPELLNKLQEKNIIKDIPILILANMQKRQQIMILMNIGIKEFLFKPYLTKSLLQKIKEMINLETISLSTSRHKKPDSGFVSLNVVEEEKRKKIIMNEIENLPAFPVIVQKVIQIVNDPKSSASDFENYVRRDQTLTAKMLRMANSSFYNVQREIILIRDAVVTLGYNTVKTIAFAAGTGDIFKRNLPQYGLAPAGLWKHSFGVALASRIISFDLGFDDEQAEELFICGLLHDIGKLVLGKFIQNEDKVYETDNKVIANICQAERSLTGYDHSELGEIISKKWQLPEKICYTIKYHHEPETATKHENEIAIINLADYICKYLRIGFNTKNKSEPKLYEMITTQLSINDDKIRYFTKEISDKLKDLDKIAGI